MIKGNTGRERSGIARRLMCVWLSLLLLLTGSVGAYAADSAGSEKTNGKVKFYDTAGHWASEYIAEGAEKNWINGYPDGTFRPQNTITRAEFVKLILSAMKLTPGSDNAEYLNEFEYWIDDFKPYEITPLSDVKNHWITTSGYMDIALKYGMVIKEEYSGGKFQPDKAITRREIAVMAMRALGLVYPSKTTEEKSSYSDAADYPDWLQGYLTMTEKTGVIEGYPDGAFRGENTATRAEALTIVSRVMKEMEKGIDESTEIYAITRWEGNVYPWDEQIKQEMSVPVIKEDGVIYADMLDLFEISEKLIPKNEIKYKSWYPHEQAMMIEVDSSYHDHKFCAGYDKSIELDSQFDQLSDIAAPKILYGHLMIPLYDEKNVQEDYVLENFFSYSITNSEWTAHYDEEHNRVGITVSKRINPYPD